jgi:hypothetical protein
MEAAVEQTIAVPPRNSGLGMTMHGKVIVELRRLGLGARPNLTPVFQQKQKRWMIAGEEGGGCTGEVGHYIGLAGVTPSGLAVSIPIQSLIPNSTQRRVISKEMIRAQLFRFGNSCDLLVTHHYLAPAAREGARPALERRVLFQGKNGILAPGTKQPVFFDHAGEAVDFSKELIPLIQAISKGATTPKNNRAHCIPLRSITLPSMKKHKVEAAPVSEAASAVQGVALIDAASAIAARTNTRAAKRNKSAPQQTVVPPQTVAPAEVDASSAV